LPSARGTWTRGITAVASISNHGGSNCIYTRSNRRRTGEVESSIIQETAACSFAPLRPGHGGRTAGGASALCGLWSRLGFDYALAVRTTASIDRARSYDMGRDGPTATRQDAQIDCVGRLWRGAGQPARRLRRATASVRPYLLVFWYSRIDLLIC
jgi:hypothetical protein